MQILNYSRERPPPCLFLWGFLWGFLLPCRGSPGAVTSGPGGGSEPGLAPSLSPSLSPASLRGRVPGRSCGAGAVRALRAPARAGGAMSRYRHSADRYRYLLFWQRPMVPLGLLQLALSALCVVSGFVDGVFRTESALGRTRAPLWAGMVRLRPFPSFSCYLVGQAGAAAVAPGFLLRAQVAPASSSCRPAQGAR